MPLLRYTIQPTHISQVRMPEKIDNELEFVSNETLCNLMHQMASVAAVAGEIFEELSADLGAITNRLSRIESQVSSISSTLKGLPTSEDFLSVGLQNLSAPTAMIGGREQELDSQVLNRNTKPRCMQAQYEAAEALPPLHVMDALRDDGKTTTRLYSDPHFFFDLWRKEMLEDAFDGVGTGVYGAGASKSGKKVAKKKRPKPKSKPPSSLGVGDTPVAAPAPPPSAVMMGQLELPLNNQNQMQQQQQQYQYQQQQQQQHYLQHQQEQQQQYLQSQQPQHQQFNQVPPSAPSESGGEPDETLTHPSEWLGSTPAPPFPRGGNDGNTTTSSCDSPPPPPPPPPLMDLSISSSTGPIAVEPIHNLPPYAPSISPQLETSGDDLNLSADLLPPPPPPAVMTTSSDNLLTGDHPPPPPPPPPPPLPLAPTASAAAPAAAPAPGTSKPAPPGPPRDFLSDIRSGAFQLRKVSERQAPRSGSRAEAKESTASRLCDVSAIFEMVSRRRQCLENTSEDDDDKTSDSCGWED